jgi:hypothetical protein
MPKIRLPDNPITFQVFTSIDRKENVPKTNIFRYRIELRQPQEGGFDPLNPVFLKKGNTGSVFLYGVLIWQQPGVAAPLILGAPGASSDPAGHDQAVRPVDHHRRYLDDADHRTGQKPETRL